MKLLAYVLSTATLSALAIQLTGCALRCTEVGCDSSVSATLDVDRDLASLDGAVVRTCRNGECVEGLLVVQASESGDLQGSCALSEEHRCTAAADGANASKITIDVFIDGDDAEDGDVFEVTIVDPADPDTVLATRDGEVDYVVSEPNGAACGPTCYNGSI